MNDMTDISAGHYEPQPFTISGNAPKLFEALAKAQQENMVAEFNQENPAFKRGNKPARYADLASVWKAVRGPLTSNGLSVIQIPHVSGLEVSVTTILAHASGGMLSGTVTTRAVDQSTHKVGAAITYLRRFGLASMVGAVADDDDDGNVAAGVGDKPDAKEAAADRGDRGLSALRAQWSAFVKALGETDDPQAALEIWTKYDVMLRSVPPTALAEACTLWRNKMGVEPPKMEGLTYPQKKQD